MLYVKWDFILFGKNGHTPIQKKSIAQRLLVY
jgi:hypothetical protein